MDPESFVRWALDDARTLEERYTTELLVERGVGIWNARNKIPRTISWDEEHERERQRAQNPAYEPHYTEQSLRRAFEGLREQTYFSLDGDWRGRELESLAPIKFFPWAEQLSVGCGCAAPDVSPVGELPNLKILHMRNEACMDYRPLARCKQLEELHLHIGRHWPCVDGINELPALKELLLSGNLMVFKGAQFPHVLSATIECKPLPLRSVRELPQLPRCLFLQLSGVECLDGIEAFPELRNLLICCPTESFKPLTALPQLTCLTVRDHRPVDLSPLVRVPSLQFLALNTERTCIRPVKPRDVSVLVDSLSLRELHVGGSKIIETEAAAVRAGLPSWDDLYWRAEPRPIPPLTMRALPWRQVKSDTILPRLPDEPDFVDVGLRQAEFRWAQRKLQAAISRKLGTSDWGQAESEMPHVALSSPAQVGYTKRRLLVEFHAFDLLDKYPLMIEAIRECLASFTHQYQVQIWNRLKAPRPIATPAQLELEEKFKREQDEADFQRLVQETEDYMERMHRLELKKQEGAKVDPSEFAPGPRKELPPPPWEKDEADDGDEDSGDIALKEKPEPPPFFLEEEHPLADNYSLMAELTLDTFWIPLQQRDVAEYLMHRPCDEVLEEPEEEGS